MNTDIASGTALRSRARKPSSPPRSASSRARSRPVAPCRCSAGSSCRPRTAGSRSPRRTWRSRSALRSRARSRATRASSSPAASSTDLVRLLPDDSVTLAYEEGDGVLTVTSGSHSSRLNVYSAEDFPRLPPLDVTLQTIDAAALLATIEKVGAGGLARRVAAGADGRPRPLRGRPADHGRDRLVPPRGEGDEPLVREGPTWTRSSRLARCRSSHGLQQAPRTSASASTRTT